MENFWKGGFHHFKKNTDNKSLPKQIIDVIDPYTLCVCISFNRAGTLLAIGCNDGRLILWDFITNTIARTFYGHTSTVTSLSWSQDDMYICTGSTDRTVVVWDILKKIQKCKCSRFISPISKVQFHPRNKNIILISSWFEVPALYSLQTHTYVPLLYDFNFQDDKCKNMEITTHGIVASYNKRGQYIFVGDALGNLFVFDSRDLSCLVGFTWNQSRDIGTSVKAKNCIKSDNNSTDKVNKGRRNSSLFKTAVKELHFSRKTQDDSFIVLCFDQWIRMYYMNMVETLIHENTHNYKQQPLFYSDIITSEIKYIEPSFQYSTPENYSGWNTCKYSNDGNYIFAIGTNMNSIFIWSLKATEPTCVLSMENTSDIITDIAWHPLYSIICSLTDGRCNVWGKQIEESWCNYEPNFNQIDHCIEYEEKEGEFDIFDEDNPTSSHQNNSSTLQDINILNFSSSPPPYLSSDESPDQENLCFLTYNSDSQNSYGNETIFYLYNQLISTLIDQHLLFITTIINNFLHHHWNQLQFCIHMLSFQNSKSA